VIGGLVKSPNRLRWLAHVGNANLLVPKRSVIGGLVKSPNRLRWLAHGKAPNRLRWLAHGEVPNRMRWLAHGEAPNRLRGLGHGVADLPYQLLWVDVPMMQIWDRSRFGIVGTF
jgi:hypothetical protein